VNELADKLAKEAARNDDMSFNRIPKSEIAQQVRDRAYLSGKFNGIEPQKG